DQGRDPRPAAGRPGVRGPHHDRQAHPPPAGGRPAAPGGDHLDRRRRQGPARSLPRRGREPPDGADRRARPAHGQMTRPGTEAQPLRVAIVGAGPTGFYAWYNGHPDYRDLSFDLSQERAAVVGVGNVAADVARILSRTPEELAATDIADYALEALSASRIREVYVLGRRGPAQAAFTNPEVRELGELAGADITALPDEVELDELTRQALERAPDRATQKKVEILKEYAQRAPTGKPRRLVMRLL